MANYNSRSKDRGNSMLGGMKRYNPKPEDHSTKPEGGSVNDKDGTVRQTVAKSPMSIGPRSA
jgi:hypothetical protein